MIWFGARRAFQNDHFNVTWHAVVYAILFFINLLEMMKLNAELNKREENNFTLSSHSSLPCPAMIADAPNAWFSLKYFRHLRLPVSGETNAIQFRSVGTLSI